MQAFHNDPRVKAKYLNRVRAHQKADELVRGETGAGGKGCAVWCTLNAYEHSRYEKELGIPEWLARVEDTLFEGMNEKKAQKWPAQFLSAIKPGDDLERVKAPFLIMVLESTLDTFDHAKFPYVKSAIDGSIALWRRKDIGSKDWNEAARAAAAAAWAAARAAEAARAAWAAAEAAWAAAAAAWAAAAAAWAAAADKYDYFADELLKILRRKK